MLIDYDKAGRRNRPCLKPSHALPPQVFDQYLNFISLEDDFFVIRHQNTHDISYHGGWEAGWEGGREAGWDGGRGGGMGDG